MANFEKPYEFNIVLNSYLASPPYDVTGNNDKSYFFNWSNIPKGRYEMTWSWRGMLQTTVTSNDNPQICLTIGSTSSNYLAGGNTTNSNVTNYIGNLQTVTHINADLYFNATQFDNCPVLYDSLPTNNVIRVQAFDIDLESPYTSASLGNEPLASYVMTLHFIQKK